MDPTEVPKPDWPKLGELPKPDSKFTVWLQAFGIAATFIVGMATGLVPMGTACIERDVRNRVYEATHEDKERALTTQGELLKLQEEYLHRLKDIRAMEDRTAEANTKAQEAEKAINILRREKEAEVAQTRLQAFNAAAGLRTRNRQLEQADADRRKQLAETEQQRAQQKLEEEKSRAKIKPFIAYRCNVTFVSHSKDEGNGEAICMWGVQSVFAKGTPDESTTFTPPTYRAKLTYVASDGRILKFSPARACDEANDPWQIAFIESEAQARKMGAPRKEIKPKLPSHAESNARFDAAEKPCLEYRRKFLSGKGLNEGDLTRLEFEQMILSAEEPWPPEGD